MEELFSEFYNDALNEKSKSVTIYCHNYGLASVYFYEWLMEKYKEEDVTM